MQEVLRNLQAAVVPNSTTDVSVLTMDLQARLTKKLLTGFTTGEIREFVSRVFQFFLNQVKKESSSIQASIRRTAYIFIMKIYPFHPDIVVNTLKQAMATPGNMDPRSASLLLDVFTVVGETIGPMFLNVFLCELRAFGYFTLADSTVCKMTPDLISRLKNLGEEWHEGLLREYLSHSVVPQQYKAVLMILKCFPNQIPRFVQDARNWDLLAFVATSLKLTISERDIASELIHDFAGLQNVGKIDTYLQILRRCTGISIEVGEETVTITNGVESTTVPRSMVASRACFYAFDLPIEVVAPTAGDNVIQLTEKFRTLANKKESVVEVFGQFDKFVDRGYDEVTTACLQNLPAVVNVFGGAVSTNVFRKFLKKVILIGPNSWFHSIDIVAVIGALDPKYYSLVGGIDVLLTKVVESLMNANEALSKTSYTVLMQMMNEDNSAHICRFLHDKMDMFSVSNMIQIMKVMTEASKWAEAKGYLRFIVAEIVEISSMHRDQIEFDNELFRFLSMFDVAALLSPASVRELKEMAFVSIYGVTWFYAGTAHADFVSRSRVEAAVESVKEYVSARDTDEIIFPNFESALRFLVSLKAVENGFLRIVVGEMLFVYPKIVTNTVVGWKTGFSASDMSDLFRQAIGYMGFDPDLEVATCWCSLYLQMKDAVQRVLGDRPGRDFGILGNWVFDHLEEAPPKTVGVFGMLRCKTDEEVGAMFESLPAHIRDEVLRSRQRNEQKVEGESEETLANDERPEFIFSHIDDKSLASEVTDMNMTLIMTQLNQKTYTFSTEKLTALIRIAATLYQEPLMKALVMYVFRHNLPLDLISNCDLSEMKLEWISQWASTATDRVSVFTMLCDGRHTTEEVEVMAHLETEIKEIMENEHIGKKRMIRLTKALQLVSSIESPEVERIALHVLSHVTHPVYLHFVAIIISHAREISDEFVSSVLEVLSIHKDYPVEYISVIVLILARRNAQCETLNTYLKQLEYPYACGCLRLRLLESSVLCSLDTHDIRSVVSKDAGAGVPSLLNACTRLVKAAFRVKPKRAEADPGKLCLPLLLSKIKGSEDNGPVMRCLARLFAVIISEPRGEKLQQLIVKNSEIFMCNPTAGRYTTFVPLLADAISFCVHDLATFDKMCAYADVLTEHSPTFSGGMPALRARMRVMAGPKNTLANAAIGLMLKWCLICHDEDCYTMDDQVKQWADLLMDYFEPEDVILHLCCTIPKYVPRYVSCAIAIIVWWRENPEIQLEQGLECARLSLVRAHTGAFYMVLAKNVQAAVKLASFLENTPESDALIEELDIPLHPNQ